MSVRRRWCRCSESARHTRGRGKADGRTDLFPRRSARGARASQCDRHRRVSAVPACQMLPCRMVPVRRAAVAGSWYPAHPDVLAREVDRYLTEAGAPPPGNPIAIIAPHAGLMYSGPIAAHAYSLLRGRDIDVAVLVGPSHYVGFEGVAIYERGLFETPFGPMPISEHCADAIAMGSRQIQPHPTAHVREHSLEMQLPFLKRVLPDTEIVPLVMGYQRRETAYALG